MKLSTGDAFFKKFIKGDDSGLDDDVSNFIKLGRELSIPEINGIKNETDKEQVIDIFLKYSDFHFKYMNESCKGFKYFNRVAELEEVGYDIHSFLQLSEDLKSKLIESNAILIRNSKTGNMDLGIYLPDINIDIKFDNIFIIDNSIYNYFYRKNNNLSFLKSSSLTLKDLLQYMESSDINDIGIDPINSFQFNISAEIAKENVLLSTKPILKDVILDLYNQAMLDMGKDHTTEVPFMTGLIKMNLLDLDSHYIDRTFRLNFIKIKNGLTLSIRRFKNYKEIDNLGLDGLSYSKEMIQAINSASEDKSGICLIAGETNSGKSTLLSTILNRLYKEKEKVISIENPIEMIMPYLQIDLTDTDTADEKHKMTKEDAQTAILRHNPDVVLISEIRSKDEINFFAGMGLRGHMAFATIHAGSIENMIEILLKAVDESELRDILNLFIHQELLAKKCKRCDGVGSFFRDDNKEIECSYCRGSGASGVIPIYEAMKFNNLEAEDSLRDLKGLIKKGKVEYVSKRVVIQKLYDDGFIFEKDYIRICKLYA